jgi:hypothetical protein
VFLSGFGTFGVVMGVLVPVSDHVMLRSGGIAAGQALDAHFDVTIVEKRGMFNQNM